MPIFPLSLRAVTASTICTGLLLAACGEGAEPASSPPAPASDAAPARPGGVEPARKRSDDESAAAPSEPGTTAPSSDALPLTPGVYVVGGEDCARPANAGFRIYDGRGLSGSSTRECRATVVSRQGDTYRVDQSCIDTYSGERTTAGQTIRATDTRSFTLTEDGEPAQTFRLCPAGQAPSYLEDLVTPD